MSILTPVRVAAAFVAVLTACSGVTGRLSDGSLAASTAAAQQAPGTETQTGDIISHQGGPTTSGLPTGTPIPMERTLPGPAGGAGGTGTGAAPGGVPGTVPGSPGANPGLAQSSSPLAADIASWAVSSNDAYGFQVSYPAQLTVTSPSVQAQLAPVARFWFQDRAVAASPIANAAPPALAVEIFDNPDGLSVTDWLSQANIAQDPARADTEAAAVGGVEGVRVTNRIQSAPNTFYYVARGAYIYRFIPLGDVGEAMLTTVGFL